MYSRQDTFNNLTISFFAKSKMLKSFGILIFQSKVKSMRAYFWMVFNQTIY